MNTDTVDIVDHINATYGFRYRLLDRFTAGEQGAYALEDERGRRAVLKWSPYPQAVQHYMSTKDTTDRLRSSGYPVPGFLHIGAGDTFSFVVQERVPGSLVEQLSPGHVDRLIELNHAQMSQAAEPGSEWQTNIIRSVLEGWSDYCVIESLRSHSANTRRLLERLQRVAAAWEGTPCPEQDIVHFDFHHRNMLVDGDTIAGIVDWDGCQAGDCLFDLVTLLFYSYDNPQARDRLWREVLERGQRATIGAYIAHMAVRQVDWMIRFYDQSGVDRFVNIAQRMLDDCSVLYERHAPRERMI